MGTELRGWLFDLDGVLVDTAGLHAQAWKAVFDPVLEQIRPAEPAGRPFDTDDYLRFVDGKPRLDGVRDFLGSRGLVLPEGSEHDESPRLTVRSVAQDKDRRFCTLLEHSAVRPYPDAVRLVRALLDGGRLTGVVSASEHCPALLEVCGLDGLFHVVVDGVVAKAQRLAGKPEPDTYVYAAQLLALDPGVTAVVEDAISGVAAGRTGRFGYVVGVGRRAPAAGLLSAGADVVVSDLDQFAALMGLLAQEAPAAVEAAM
ncbi:MAG TPA: haloacid dehalogenase [Acidimicrobiaceae bacterium]|nr:haloacid dehalogenase [Acidimicrobiaceae bacterium]